MALNPKPEHREIHDRAMRDQAPGLLDAAYGKGEETVIRECPKCGQPYEGNGLCPICYPTPETRETK